jgi:hypothetical protein
MYTNITKEQKYILEYYKRCCLQEIKQKVHASENIEHINKIG